MLCLALQATTTFAACLPPTKDNNRNTQKMESSVREILEPRLVRISCPASARDQGLPTVQALYRNAGKRGILNERGDCESEASQACDGTRNKTGPNPSTRDSLPINPPHRVVSASGNAREIHQRSTPNPCVKKLQDQANMTRVIQRIRQTYTRARTGSAAVRLRLCPPECL